MRTRIGIGVIGLAAVVVAMAACGELDDSQELVDDGVVEASDEAGDSKADRADLKLTALSVAGLPAWSTRYETRRVFSTARSFRDYFGFSATGVDFAKEWVAFYSAGQRPTGGYTATITRVRLSNSAATLKVTTSLESPGPTCVVTQATTRPAALVKFARPQPRPSYVSYASANRTRACATTSCATITPTDLTKLDLSVVGKVRAVYLRPSDRPFRDCAQERLDQWITLGRDFYRGEMQKNGYDKIFTVDTTADGAWQIVYLVGEHDAAWYQAQADAPGAAMAEMIARLPAAFHNNNVTLYLYDLATVENKQVRFSGNGGSGAPWEGPGAGYVLQGLHFLGVGFETVAPTASGQAALFADATPSGIEDWTVDGQWRELTRGEYASSMVGAALHELGHAFYLDHVFDLTDGLDLNLMGNGFRRFAGPAPRTILGPTSAAALDGALFFTTP